MCEYFLLARLLAQLFQGAHHFDGHIQNRMGVFGVHYGDPDFLLDIPSPEKAAAPDGYNFDAEDFRCPRWVNPKFPYLVLLPKYNPFHGPLFSCLNVTKKNLPIEQVAVVPLGDKCPQTRWGLVQSLIDRWVNLESLLRLTLRTMMGIYGGPAATGVYTFLSPICYRYTERYASSYPSAVDIALRSRDAFLPMMAKITLMIILLDAQAKQALASLPPDDWRTRLVKLTKLPWQWLDDLEHSAVGDFTIDRMGGLIDLTLSKTHPNHQLPRHARWLLPHLLGRHRVPLYFYYGQVFPLKEPVPDALIEKGFVPEADEISYLQNIPGDVAFSPWSLKSSVWKSRRDGAPSSPSPSHAAQTYQHSETLADSPVPVKSFPAVERGSGQKAGEDIHAFMERRRLHNAKRTQLESSQARTSRLAKEQHASKGAPPGKKGACVFIWEEEDGGFFIRRACNRQDAVRRPENN
ncbi:hypothetical protein C8R47DRAFT_1229726 [Mycena vitilis]|nr:hypothetical protein C8R47DRAFT_1229726 [Mycena vitilis]